MWERNCSKQSHSNHIRMRKSSSLRFSEKTSRVNSIFAEISNIGQGVAQGCSMSPILLSNFINQLLDEVEKAVIGINIKKDVQVGGLMFADDFVGLTTNTEDLQTLINVLQGFCKKWSLKSNIQKSAVMVIF